MSKKRRLHEKDHAQGGRRCNEDEKIEGDYCGHLLINGVACFYCKTEDELMNDFKEVVEFYLENSD